MFRPSFRYQPEKIRRQSREIIRSAQFASLLHDAPIMLFILNDARQVVYTNRQMPAPDVNRLNPRIAGNRPGECLDCIHAHEGKHGCGTTAYCKVCGLANTIKLSESGREGSGECSISLSNGESLTLKVHARPFEHHNENYVFVALQDISDLKARLMLESIFLHDLKNTAAILSGLNEVFEHLQPDETRRILKEVAVRINDEVEAYRLITSAENHLITTNASTFNLNDLIGEVIVSLRYNHDFRQKEINYQENLQVLKTDRTLLRQVLMNMLKNALEAGEANDPVKVGHYTNPQTGNVCIFVQNQQVMPARVKLQVFQKSFSTKGQGRGWGTYGVKLLTEKFLRGKASFVSKKDTGTVFTIELPENILS